MNRNYLFWLALICYSLMSFSLFAQFAGGTGTELDPYQVATAEHLNNVRNYSGSRFIQTADIDLGVPPWNQGEGWVPISFSGSYEGNGKIISNLYILRPNDDYQALFGSNSGQLYNLGVVCHDVTGHNYVAAIVAFNNRDCTIVNCFNSGTIRSTDYGQTGGIAGQSHGAIINSYSIGRIYGSVYSTGGLLGWLEGSGTVVNSFSGSLVNGGTYTGGLVGNKFGGGIVNSYCYGKVDTLGVNQGGMIGRNLGYGYISNSYFDVTGSGFDSSGGGEGRTTTQMTFPYASDTYVGWDFDSVWQPSIGYPRHRNITDNVSNEPLPVSLIAPLYQSVSNPRDVPLAWAYSNGLTSENRPTGFKLSLGTNNPPTNILDEVDIGWRFCYYPDLYLDLEYNTDYYWMITPYNDLGDATDCPVWQFKTYDPDNELIYPNGDEIWQSGTTRTIKWSDNAAPDVEVSVSFNNGAEWIQIATVEGQRGYYHYQVPFVNSTNCLIKIASQLDESQFDTSDNSFSISTSSTQPKVLLSYPSAEGINLKVGDAVNLAWTRQNVSSVSIDYSTDDGQTWTDILSNLEANSYLWTIPDNPTMGCRIRLRSHVNSEVMDISDNSFSISKIQLLSPNGGEIITGDYSSSYRYPVTWSAPGTNRVKVEYSANGGANWSVMTTNAYGNSGLYYLQVPSVPTVSGLIRVSNAANSAINDVSDTPFIIRNPIRLTNANGGGYVTNNSMFNIRWKIQDISPSSQIYWEYYANNSNWTRINTSAVPVTDGYMYWFVNTGLVDNMWLRAVDYGTLRVVGMSEAPFRVTDKILQLFEPNGGENYAALTTQTISWDHDGLTDLSIYFSSDDGVSWTQIAANVPASTLTYSWIVPETPSVNCRMNLQDQTYPWMVLESDLPFTVSPLQVINPTVDFSADILTGDIPLAVQFTEMVNPGVGNIANRLWDFGDGNTSADQNPLHSYTVAGSYTVSLTITNDFGGSTTETKADFIIALPNTPRIELLSATSLNYGVVYLGDTSPAQTVEVKNVGTAPLNLGSVSWYLANSQFALAGTELPLIVPVYGTAQLSLVFVPSSSGTVSDSLYIHSDASNLPTLALKLSAVGEYVPPAAVEGLVVTVVGNDAQLTWLPVSTTIYGTPIQPDGYIVLYNETPYEDAQFYYFHSFVTGTGFVHPFVAQYRTEMFYRIVAVKNYREEALAWLRSLNGSRDRYTWGELREKLNPLKQRQ